MCTVLKAKLGRSQKSDSSTHRVGGDPAQEQYESTANPSWDMQGWKRSGAALWKMHFPNIFAVLGDGDVQSLPGFTWDSRGWGSGAVGTHKHVVGCIAPCCIRENLDLLAFFLPGDLRKFDWEKVVGQELNLGLRDPY